MKIQLASANLILGLILAESTRAYPQSQNLSAIRQELSELRAEIRRLAEKIDRLQVGGGRPMLADPNSRNPFHLPDVPDPDGTDVRQFAAKVNNLGRLMDENAKQWVSELTTVRDPFSIDGEWFSRWNRAGGPWVLPYSAEVRSVGDRVYVLYRDHQGMFLVDMRRDKDLLVGRLVGVENPTDSSPIVIRIVGPDRLDGSWGGGRIDFRRKLQ